MSDKTTPKDLERELGVGARTIRAYLRSTYPKVLYSRWVLSPEQVREVRAHFGQT
jgi:hypothetical protein